MIHFPFNTNHSAICPLIQKCRTGAKPNSPDTFLGTCHGIYESVTNDLSERYSPFRGSEPGKAIQTEYRENGMTRKH